MSELIDKTREITEQLLAKLDRVDDRELYESLEYMLELHESKEAQRQRIAQFEEQQKVAEHIEGSFRAALRLLNLTELDVHNPGRHFTERIAELEARIQTLQDSYDADMKHWMTRVKELEAEVARWKAEAIKRRTS